jgi:hypothetical protein
MTDPEINQAIHDHLGLPRTFTAWEITYLPHKDSPQIERKLCYSRQSDVDHALELIVKRGGAIVGGVEPKELLRQVKDYCNDRDAMAEVIAGMKEHDTGGFIYELAPGWVDAEIINDELVDFALKMLTAPCRDLAVAFYKTIHPDKITP